MKITVTYYDQDMNIIPKEMAEETMKKFNEKWKLQTEIPNNRLYYGCHLDWFKPHEEFTFWKRVYYEED